MCTIKSGLSCKERKALNLCGKPSPPPRRLIALEQLSLEMDADGAASGDDSSEARNVGPDARPPLATVGRDRDLPRFL